MPMSYALVSKRPALLHRLTGLTNPEFERLLDKFSSHYSIMILRPRITASDRKRKPGAGQKGALPEIADKLLFILSYVRIYPLLIIQGVLFGMAESKACKWTGILLPVLDMALESAHVRPKRARGRSLEEVIAEFPELVELGILTDGVERPVRRPKNKDDQKDQYSGKKKRHTKKNVTITHPKSQYILAVSEEHPGRDHDKKIIDQEELRCHSPIPIGVDSGFVGLTIGLAKVRLPVKRKRKQQGEPKDVLTDEQKTYNHALASARVAVEHSNAGFKRNRSVQDILRNTREGMSDQLMMVATGLHNLRVTMRSSYQS